VCDLETSRICTPYIYDISHLSVKKFYRRAGPRNWFTELFPGHFGFEIRCVCEMPVLRFCILFVIFSRKTSRYYSWRHHAGFLPRPFQFTIQWTSSHSILVYQEQDATCARHLGKLPVENNIYVFYINRNHEKLLNFF
jgi:hypothetical protein